MLRPEGYYPLYASQPSLQKFRKYSLLSTDQGIRGLLFVFNDLCYVCFNELKLNEWQWDSVYAKKSTTHFSATEEGAVSIALDSLRPKKVANFLGDIASRLSEFDWRTSATPDLKPEQRQQRLTFRGSSGYKEIRRQLLEHLSEGNEEVVKAAKKVSEALGY